MRFLVFAVLRLATALCHVMHHVRLRSEDNSVVRAWTYIYRSVVRAPASGSKGRGFKSLQERREDFLVQGQLSVLTPISVSVPPPCYRSSTYKIPVILPKVQVAGYILRMWLCMVTWCMVVWCTQNLRQDGSSFMRHQPCQRLSTPLRWIFKNAL